MKQKSPSNPSSSLSLYLEEVGKFPLLSSEKKKRLYQGLLSSDAETVKKARQELIQSNLRLVIPIAKRYENRALSNLMDLIQEGNLGLSIAAKHFDPTKHNEFSTLATVYIESYIRDEARAAAGIIALPKNKRFAKARIYAVASRLAEEGKEVSPEIIHEELQDCPISLIEEMLSLPGVNDVSSGEEVPIIEDVPSKLDLQESLSEALEQVKHLSETQRFVLIHYFGLEGEETMSLSQIGKQLGVSKERVRQIKETALFQIERSSRRKP